MATSETIHSNMEIPPGEYLEEVLDELAMSKKELAERMDRPAAKLSAIFKGEKAITPDTALRLEKVVGVSAHIWAGLESEYRLALQRQMQESREEQLKDETQYITKFRYNELAKLGEVQRFTRPVDKVRELQKFFGVVSLDKVYDLDCYQVAFRCGKAGNAKRSPEALATWLQLGRRKAQPVDCKRFSKRKLRANLNEFRKMTRWPPTKFQLRLTEILAECGVALVVLPYLPRTYAHGAAFWHTNDKAVLMITNRCKWADIFWFSLFHEIGHLLLHDKQTIIEDNADDRIEQEADEFAANALIPQGKFRSLVEQDSFYDEKIIAFADKVGVDPGIVVGRLQHEDYIKHSWGNKLRTQYNCA